MGCPCKRKTTPIKPTRQVVKKTSAAPVKKVIKRAAK